MTIAYAKLLGIVSNDPEAAAHNTAIVEACRTGIKFRAEQYHFETPVRYNLNGGALIGAGSSLLRTSSDAQYTDNNAYYMPGTRFVPSNPDPDTDFLLLRGTGQKVVELDIHGREWPTFTPSPSGPRCRSCIAVEALAQPPSGRTKISDCLLADTDVGIRTSEGDGGTHADLLHVSRVYASNCRAFFQSNSNQSVCHRFYGCFMESDVAMVAFEILKGGKIRVFGFDQNGPFATLLAVGDDGYPNTNNAEIYGYIWDHYDAVGAYFNPLDTTHSTFTGIISGHANNPQFGYEFRNTGLLLNTGMTLNVAGIAA